MNAITRRLSSLAIATAIAGAGLASATASTAHAWTGCQGDCVSSITITQTLDTKATPKLNIVTSVPTKVLVTFKEVAGATAGAVSSASTSYSSTHSLNAGPILTQGKGYVVSVKATDQSGQSYTDQTSVTALSRTVTVTLTSIAVREDSDYGAGEIAAGLKVGNGVTTVFGTRSITAPKTVSVAKTYTFKNVVAGAKVMVELQDDDVDFGEFCPSGTSFSFTNGSTSCYDWTTGKTSVAALNAIGSATRTFTLLGDGRLKFSVDGTYTVKVG